MDDKEYDFNLKPYPITDKKENESVSIFDNLIDKKRIKSFINTRDKIPNYDGKIELVDVEEKNIGFLFVQVKALKETQPPKYSISTSFIGFCLKTNVPVLLIGVDIDNKKAYWIHIDHNYISTLKFKKKQKSKTINFPLYNLINGKDKKYIKKWEQILEKQKKSIQLYDEVINDNKKFKEIHKEFLDYKIGDINNIYKNLHLFIDKYNDLIERYFTFIKRKIYENPWKFGIAFYPYKNNNYGYSIYPIPWDKNDALIRKGNNKLWNKLGNLRYAELFYDSNNHLMQDPEFFAERKIYDLLNTSINQKELINICNPDLSIEYIFAVIKKLFRQFGLEDKISYKLKDIEYGFFKYFPLWVDEATKFLISINRNGKESIEDCYTRAGYIDPSYLSLEIFSNEKNIIEENIQQRIINKDFETRKFIIGDSELSLNEFKKHLYFLKIKGFNELRNPYSKKGYSGKQKSHYTHEEYTNDDIKKNIKKVFSRLPEVYNNFIEVNFSNSPKEFRHFDKISQIIVIYKINPISSDYFNRLSLHLFFLEGFKSNNIKTKIEFIRFNEEKSKYILKNKKKDELILDGKKFNINKILSRWTTFREIFSTLPLQKIVYNLIRIGMNKFFEKSNKWYDNNIRFIKKDFL